VNDNFYLFDKVRSTVVYQRFSDWVEYKDDYIFQDFSNIINKKPSKTYMFTIDTLAKYLYKISQENLK
jgi:hypothetical protein